MNRSRRRSLVFTYIYLASGCVAIGTLLTLALITVTDRLGINLFDHIWMLAIPSILSLFLNVLFIEMFNKVLRK